MARPILEAGCRFEHVFCSVATRARMTIEGIAASLPGSDIQWRIDERLYTFSARALLDWVHDLDDGLNDVVMVGHNPGMTDFCSSMGDKYIPNMPTCAYAQLRFTSKEWSGIGPGSGRLEAFITPKSLD